MKEIALTDAELWALWDVAVDAFEPEPPPSKELLAVFVRAALAAVPRLALASPAFREALAMRCAELSDPDEAPWPRIRFPSIPSGKSNMDVPVWSVLATLTGEEGRDNAEG